jgi:hypothetical protein
MKASGSFNPPSVSGGNKSRDIEKIAENWKNELNKTIELANVLDKDSQETAKKLASYENLAIFIDQKLRKLLNLHNSIDFALDEIMKAQNNISDELSRIHQEILVSKGLESSENIESIEEIYKRAESIAEFKKGIENSLVEVEEKFTISGREDSGELREIIRQVLYLKGKIVRNIQRMLDAKMENFVELL